MHEHFFFFFLALGIFCPLEFILVKKDKKLPFKIFGYTPMLLLPFLLRKQKETIFMSSVNLL